MWSLDIFWTFLKLGLYAFGGPAAHLVLFHRVLVQQKKWLSDVEYSQLLALGQLLPGPTSSQVGLGIGYLRGGYWGAFMAWLGFSLPSVLLMLAAAVWLQHQQLLTYPHALQALQLIVIAVVWVAFWQMLRSFCTKAWQYLLVALCSGLLLVWQHPAASVAVLGLGALFGLFLHDKVVISASASRLTTATTAQLAPPKKQHQKSWLFLVAFVALLLCGMFSTHPLGQALYGFYQSGALVFGGGHVVLPLLAQEFVAQSSGHIQLDAHDFNAGYALAQLVPGPLFSFAAYVGALLPLGGSVVVNGLLASIAMFLPGMLLLLAAIPYWSTLMAQTQIKHAVLGMNAAVVSLLVVLIIAMTTKYVHAYTDVIMILLSIILLKSKCPVWLSLTGLFSLYVSSMQMWS